MLDRIGDTHSLTHFKRHTAEVIVRLKQAGEALVLTVHGKAEVVVQDPASFQRLIELAGRAEMLEFLQGSRQDMEAGRTVPAREALDRLARKHRLRVP